MTRNQEPKQYRILVEGALDPSLGGLHLSVRQEPDQREVTVLTGPLQDQAALQGVLETLFMLRMPLLLVQCCPHNAG